MKLITLGTASTATKGFHPHLIDLDGVKLQNHPSCPILQPHYTRSSNDPIHFDIAFCSDI